MAKFSDDIEKLNAAIEAAVAVAKSDKYGRRASGFRSKDWVAVSKAKLHALKRALRKLKPRILGAE